ncbi:MAG TPA: flavin reductase family protein [Pseudonocardia sp.]|jgi:flavin reductase (DIM6/NTAB) family NADH-FMN oxidoreductase RutF
MTVDPADLRRCLGHFATGVTVVTCSTGGPGEGAPHGATVNAFSAVSLDPPLVLVSLDRRSRACRYLDGRPFTVNLLTEQRDDVALHFAGRPMDRPPGWRPGGAGLAPRLDGALAWIACTPWRRYDGGDHVLFLGEVQRFEYSGADPLVFYLGAFRHLGQARPIPPEAVPWLGSADCPGLSWFAPTPASLTQRSTA